MKLYQKIARVVSQKNTSLNVIEKELALLQELLPIGNGIETGCVISLKSTKKRIVIDTINWHPNYSDKLTKHQVVITPSFEGEINIRITGKSEGDIKDYLWDIFREELMKEYEVFKKGWDVKDSSEIESELDYVLD
jgi:hypothetical protein